MLCQFTVKNFQCFKDEITLDMQAASIPENEESVITDIDGEKFLPISVIYGPNGAGKSTVLYAIYSLACKIMRPIEALSSEERNRIRSSDNISAKPFKFAKETLNAPTEYEIFFRTEKCEYQYRISTRKDKIIYEALYKKFLSRSSYSTVFIRNENKIEQLSGYLKSDSVEDISDDLALLSYFGITHRRNSTIKDIIGWFDKKFSFINYGNPTEDATIAISNKGATKSLILKMMAETDIDVSDYRIVKNHDKSMAVYTSHTVDDIKYELDLREESHGTIKFFGLLPYIAGSIINGSTLIVDELDAKLHPLLLEYIIKLYNDPAINKKHAQLIFTSHDLITMNSENFRRDEIWFAAKGTKQESLLYSLIEFKKENGTHERNDERYNKQYLEGRYGADPYFKKIINWGEV